MTVDGSAKRMTRATIRCDKEKAAFDRLLHFASAHGNKPKPPKIVTLHGKECLVYGEAKGRGYHYAAVKIDGDKGYEIIDPRHIVYQAVMMGQNLPKAVDTDWPIFNKE